MTLFTIIGFWPSILQRFCTSLVAQSADHAEAICLEIHAGIAVCGVIGGEHTGLDSGEYVVCATE